ncbi:hypothetical protein [Streptomyces gibsoniae]|uniref:Uncharacterized protein n=1 Tax=Streptomyces gibsoniae TaxID=3075529 RepID=A0ABU2TML7_9ACTN|nr:hypothetical protein [Streptomyces sp. DSM 41699]MDT0462184.1 hypothetical protein [Streptomyces sp. DSM 41699]
MNRRQIGDDLLEAGGVAQGFAADDGRPFGPVRTGQSQREAGLQSGERAAQFMEHVRGEGPKAADGTVELIESVVHRRRR